MKGYDALRRRREERWQTRRAAKMVNLDVDHRTSSTRRLEESTRRRRPGPHRAGLNDPTLHRRGYGKRLFSRTPTHSVRVTDEFMRAVENGGD